MAQQSIGVNLKFSADVSAAKRAMQDLQNSLAQIHKATSTSSNPGIMLSKDLNQASQAAAMLRVQLQSAFNADTGKLNLTKFNMDMKNAGMTIQQYKAQLTSIGPMGQQAFTQLAQSIAMAETSALSLSAGLQRLGTTFWNTVRYQISSSAIMGVVQGISEAIDYTKELNESLNNIRIVTNYGVDEMKSFAVEANKAAKALSTTTKEMTDASLIYFQQGLNMQEAQRRAEITLKLANVTGEAVSTVSDQLTAVWNNFDDGVTNLEYYADVLTALGAATASSSDEISQGLEKFAAVANTVGLSYEYATAALATVTATTRQSADVVGTAFKTLFARIQDLELGKELEDGVTLGQYSQGLAAIGVNVLDANGGLKDMNDILDDLGSKWDSLSKAQQVATAQTVAGVRQYTQLIALMDNWSYFQENLGVAQSASGTLQEQQEIYAESWEAAAERVTAALETIFNKLLDDEAFIDIMNTFEDFLGLVSSLIDGLGGLPGVLALVGGALTRMLSSQMINGLNNLQMNIRSLTPQGRAENKQLQQDAVSEAASIYGTTGTGGQQGALAKSELSTQTAYLTNQSRMTELERQMYKIRMDEIGLQKDSLLQEMEKTKTLEQQASTYKKISEQLMSSQFNLQHRRTDGFTDDEIDAAEARQNPYLGTQYLKDKTGQTGFQFMTESERQRAYGALQHSSAAVTINQQALDIQGEDTFKSLTSGGQIGDGSAQITAINELQNRLKNLGVTADQVDAQMADVVGPELTKDYQALAAAADAAEQQIKQYAEELAEKKIDQSEFEAKVRATTHALEQSQQNLTNNATAMQDFSEEAILMAGGTQDSTDAVKNLGTQLGDNQNKVMQLRQQYGGLQDKIDQTTLKTLKFGQAIQQAATSLSTITMMVTSTIGLIKTLGDESVSAGDKVTTVLTTLGFMIPMIIGLFSEQNKQLILTIGKSLALTGAQKGLTASTEITSFSMLKLNAVMKGLRKTMLKFAAWAAAIALVVGVVKRLTEVADAARNASANFAAAAQQGAKDVAEAFNNATAAANELKQTISSYEEAMVGIHELTKGTNEYREALFNANEQALALVRNHASLKYYIDANGLIVFEEGELERIEAEAQQKRIDAYETKISADQAAREANIENSKTQLGRKLKGVDLEDNSEDAASRATGTAIGAGVGGAALGIGGAIAGAKLGGTLGSFLGPIGTVAGVIIGGGLGLAIGSIASATDNDATTQEKDATEAIYEAYQKQGDAALTGKGLREALAAKGITDPDLIASLEANKKELQALMQEMEANTAATKAETQMLAAQVAQSLDPTLKNKDEIVQVATTNAFARIREDLQKDYEANPDDYHQVGLFETVATQTGEDAFAEWASANGLVDFDAKDFKDSTIKYEGYDTNTGERVEKEVTYAQIAAWKTQQDMEKASTEAYKKITEAIGQLDTEVSEGLLSIIGEQDLYSLSAKEVEAFKNQFESGQLNAYVEKYWAELGYGSQEAFTAAIVEGIANWDYDTALSKYKTQIESEISGILSAGSKETEYTTGALENYTEALQRNTEYLQDNTDEWANLEKKKLAAKIAVANAKLVKGIESLNSVLTDNIDVLLKWSEAALDAWETSLDTWEAVDQVQTALEGVFGFRVSANFIRDNLADIQDLAQGGTESLEELSRAAAVDFALNLDTASVENRTWFANLLDEFADMAANKTITIDGNINDEGYIKKLNEMLDAGEITAEQVQSAFGALGYVPDIKYRKEKQTTVSTHYVFEGGGDTSKLENATRKVVSVVENDIQVPYIAGENTEAPADVEGYNKQENGSGFTLTRDLNSVGDSVADLHPDNSNKISKSINKEVERYHEVNEILSDLERHYKQLDKIKSRAYGQSHLNAIAAEASKTQELIEANKRLYQEAESYLLGETGDRAKLEGMGAIFDSEGRISNYEELQREWATWYHNVMDSNIGEETKAAAEEKWQEFQEATKTYEDSVKTLKETELSLIDLVYQSQDLVLEAIQYYVDTNIDILEGKIELLSYQIEHLFDPATKGAETILLIGGQMEATTKEIETLANGVRDVFKAPFEDGTILTEDQISQILSGDFSALEGKELNANQIKTLEDYQKQLITQSNNLSQYKQELFKTMESSAEEWHKEFEKANSEISFYTSTLETYKNIVDLVGRKNLGVSATQLTKLAQQQAQASISAVQAAQAQLKFSKENLATLEAAKQAELDKVGEDAEARKRIEAEWKETIDNAKEEVQEMDEAARAAEVNSLEAIAESFSTSIQLAAESFEEALSGVYGTFENLQRMFDQLTKANERYVESYQKTYELTKLNRDINKTLDDTQSIKGKTILKNLQQEITALQESETEMTEYDLEYLRKKYDLKVAEIALEEAQNAKSQVRMRRDSEGNWSYVYTADQDNIDQAQQNYEDKLYASQEYTQERITDIQSQILDNERTMLEELNNLNPQMDNYQQARLDIIEFYTQQELYLKDQLNKALTDAQDIYYTDWSAYSQMTGYKLDDNKLWTDSWSETILAQTSGFDTLEGRYAAFITATQQLTTETGAAYELWSEQVGAALDAAGDSAELFGSDMTSAIGNINTALGILTDNLTNTDTGLVAKATAAFNGVVNAATAIRASYEAEMKLWNNAAASLASNLQKIIELQGQVKDPGKQYYGTMTVGDQTYRTAKAFDTEEEAKAAAAKMIEDYNTWVGKYNAQVVKQGGSKSELKTTASTTGGTINSVSGMSLQEAPEAQEYQASPSPDKYIPSTLPGADDPEKYVGTYVDPITGVTYRTVSGYSNSEDAKLGAKDAASLYLKAEQARWREAATNTGTKEAHKNYAEYSNALANINNVEISSQLGRGELKTGDVSTPKGYTTTDNLLYTEGNVAGYGYDSLKKSFYIRTQGGVRHYYDPYGENAWGPDRTITSFLSLIKMFSKAQNDSGLDYNRPPEQFAASPSGDLRIFDPPLEQEDLNVGTKVSVAQNSPIYLEQWLPTGSILVETPIGGWQGNKILSWGTEVNNGDTWDYNGKTYIRVVGGYQSGVGIKGDYWVPLSNITVTGYNSFDTGGYTGEWDSSGRLAMLHQKEIVLNAHDTENFLSAINIVRDIASMIDLRAAAQQSALTSMYAASVAPMTQTLQQEVTIHAEFPNATQRTEIEAAFDTLLNRASQFANRKN